MSKLCVAIALLCTQCFAQEIFSGTCKDYNVHIVQNFDVKRYSGLWYELKRYEAIFQIDSDCVTANYSIIGDNKIKVINRAKYLQYDTENSIEGVAHLSHPKKKEGKLKVQFPFTPEADYWVIGTDYENYSIVWTCITILVHNLQFLWVLTRTPTISEDLKKDIDDILMQAKLDLNRFRKTNNDPETCRFIIA